MRCGQRSGELDRWVWEEHRSGTGSERVASHLVSDKGDRPQTRKTYWMCWVVSCVMALSPERIHSSVTAWLFIAFISKSGLADNPKNLPHGSNFPVDRTREYRGSGQNYTACQVRNMDSQFRQLSGVPGFWGGLGRITFLLRTPDNWRNKIRKTSMICFHVPQYMCAKFQGPTLESA